MIEGNNQSQPSLNAINANQQATMAPQVVKTSGAGKAYQSIAQSTAIAVQDATDYLRNMNTISTTVVGVAMAELIANGDIDKYNAVMNNAQSLVSNSATNFKTIGEEAGNILKNFPSS